MRAGGRGWVCVCQGLRSGPRAPTPRLQITCECELPPSDKPYIVIPSTYEAGNCWQFAMRVYCKDPFDFVPFQEEPFPPPNWTTQRFSGRWQGPTAGGCVKFPTFKNNPQFGLQIPGDKCKVVILLKQRGTAFPIQALVADKRGARATALYKHEMIADSGSYIAQEEVCHGLGQGSVCEGGGGVGAESGDGKGEGVDAGSSEARDTVSDPEKRRALACVAGPTIASFNKEHVCWL